MKEIPKLSIQLNLNYQLIYLVKSIHCITKESINQNRKPNIYIYIYIYIFIYLFIYFSLSENLA